jgi:hypothetical protein
MKSPGDRTLLIDGEVHRGFLVVDIGVLRGLAG